MFPTSLDTIGLTFFSYDFSTILDRPSAVGSSFKAIANAKAGILDLVIFALQPSLPFLDYIPTGRRKALNVLHAASSDLARKIIARTYAEGKDERSIIGTLRE
jgi:hypothetical protein